MAATVEDAGSTAAIVGAVFRRLNTLLQSFSSEQYDATIAAGDRRLILTSDTICGFGKAQEVPYVFAGFDKSLVEFRHDETMSYIVLKLMYEYAQRLGSGYKGSSILEPRVLSSLCGNLVRCRSCYESRIVVSVFLNLNLSNASTDINAALHQTTEVSSDFFIDQLLRFLSSTDETLFLELVLATFRQIIAAAPRNRDVIHHFVTSKAKYGYFEVLAQAVISTTSIELFMRSLIDLVVELADQSPLFVQVFGYFSSPPIMSWIQACPEHYVAQMKGTDTTSTLFDPVINIYKKAAANNENPTTSVLNFRSLTCLIILNQRVFQKFDVYLEGRGRGHGGPNEGHGGHGGPIGGPGQFSNTDIKMFSVLMQLVTPATKLTVDEKHLTLKSFMYILFAAASVSKVEPDHAIVTFCRKHFDVIYGKIKDICGTISASPIENPLIEYSKIDFFAYSMSIMPDKVFPLYMYYVENYYALDLYSYYIIMRAIQKLNTVHNGTEIMIKYFLNRQAITKIVEIGFSISEIMKTTFVEYLAFLSHTSSMKADLSDSSILEEHASATDRLSSNSSSVHSQNGSSLANAYSISHSSDPKPASLAKSANGKTHTSSSEFQIDYSSILSNQGYLARKVYDMAFDYCSIAIKDFLPLDDLFIPDADISASPEKFNAFCDSVFDRGYIAESIILGGLFDCQYSCFESTCRFIMRVIQNQDLQKTHLYYLYGTNVNLLGKWYDRLVSQSLYENQQTIHHYTFILKFTPMFVMNVISKVDTPKVYSDPDSIRYKKFIEVGTIHEKFLYVSLCGATTESYSSIKDAIRLYVQGVEMDPSPLSEALKDSMNWNLLVAMAKDSDVIIKSQKFLQKKVAHLFSNHVDKFSQGLKGAIDVAYDKIKDYFVINSLNKVELTALSNYSTFLAIVLGFGVPSNTNEAWNFIKGKQTHKFLQGLITTLTCANMKKRAVAEDILSNELHSNLAFAVFIQFVDELAELETKSKSTILTSNECEKICSYNSVLEKTLRRLPSIMVCQNSWRCVKVTDIVVSILKNQYNLIVNHGDQIPRSTTPTVAVLYAKIKLAAIRYMNSISKRIEDLRIRGTFILWRNDILKILLHWLEMAFFKDEIVMFTLMMHSNGVGKISNYVAKVTHTYREVVLEIVACLSTFSSGLLIIRRNINYEKEVKIFRNIMFGNYYNVLIRILKKCLHDASNDSTVLFNSKNKLSYASNFEFNKLELEKITQGTINILGNLVKANYEIGSNYILPLITDTNPVIKDAFLQIFRHIFIDQDGHTLEEKISSKDTTQFVYNGLRNPEIVLAIRHSITSADMDRVSASFLEIIESGGFLQHSLTLLINHELDTCLQPLDILRRNNLTTKLLSLVAKNHGSTYLRDTVGPVLDEIVEKKDFFEVDQFYQGTEGISNEDSGRFFHYFTLLVDRICGSVDAVPLSLKATCFNLRQCVHKHTSDRSLSLIIIGTYFFLRFLCPAIAYPEELKLISFNADHKAKRCFVLLTKALQNASNGTLNIEKFPLLKGKEHQMQSLIDKISGFVETVSSYDMIEQVDVIADPPKQFSIDSFKILYSFVVNQAERIRQYTTSITFPSINSMEFRQKYYHNIDRSFEALGYKFLRFYPDVADFIRANKNKYIVLYELVNRSLHDPLAEQIVESKFFSESVAKDGTQVFCVTVSYFNNLEWDPQLLVARILQALSRTSTAQYNIVIDCTLYNHPQRTHALTRMAELLNELVPDELAEKCAGVFYVNVSSTYASKLIKSMESRSYTDKKFMNPQYLKFTFLSSFEDQKTIESFNLPEWIYSISTGGKYFVNDIVYYDPATKKTFPVRLRITDCHIIYSLGELKKMKIGRFTRPFKMVNFEPLADWKGLKESADSFLAGSFEVYSLLLGETLHFASAKKNEIISVYHLNMSGYQVNLYNQTKKLMLSDKEVTSTDLSGEAVITIGLGLLADDLQVRKNSYDLLYQFHGYLKFENNRTTESAATFAPPKSHLAVSSFSTNLARVFPHLTKEVVTAFVYIANNSDSIEESIKDLFLLLEPWISNVYEYVYLSEDIDGVELTRSLIAAIVKNVPAYNTDLIAFNNGTWSKFVLTESIVDILIEEVIKEVLSREFSGIKSDTLINLMTLNASTITCSAILSQLLQATNLSVKFEGQTARIDLYWSRITILLKICISLFFDRLFLVEKFVPELVSVCMLYFRRGTQETKLLIRELSINVINTLATNSFIAEENKHILWKTTKKLANTQFYSAFGLHSKSEPLVYSETTSAVFYYDYFSFNLFANELLTVLTLPVYFETGLYRTWHSKLFKIMTPLIRNNESVFQRRALSFVGLFTSTGTQDLFVKDFLKNLTNYIDLLWSNTEKFRLEIFLTHTVAVSRMLLGLQDDSVYFSVFCWISVCFSFYKNALLFEPSFFTLSTIIVGMNRRGFFKDSDMWDVVFPPQRLSLMAKYLSKQQLSLIYQKDVFMIVYISKTLSYIVTINSLMETAIEFAVVRITFAKKNHLKNSKFDLNSIGILSPFFICMNSLNGLFDILVKSGFAPSDIKHHKLDGTDEVPELYIQFLLSGTSVSKAALLSLCKIFSADWLEMKFKIRFLKLIKALASQNRQILDFVFPLINHTLLDLCSNDTTPLDCLVLANEIHAMMGIQLKGIAQKPFKAPHQKFLEEQNLDPEIFEVKAHKSYGLTKEDIERAKNSKITRMIYLGLKQKEEENDYMF